MAMFNQDSPAPPSPQVVQNFLDLLDEINHIQQTLLEETAFLRARVRELEARGEQGDGAGRQS